MVTRPCYAERSVRPADGCLHPECVRQYDGGKTAAAGNVISGNQNAGVYIISSSGVLSGNIVERNLVGLAMGGGAARK